MKVLGGIKIISYCLKTTKDFITTDVEEVSWEPLLRHNGWKFLIDAAYYYINLGFFISDGLKEKKLKTFWESSLNFQKWWKILLPLSKK